MMHLLSAAVVCFLVVGRATNEEFAPSRFSCTGNCTLDDKNFVEVECGSTTVPVISGNLVQLASVCASPTINRTGGCLLRTPYPVTNGPKTLLASLQPALAEGKNASIQYKFMVQDNMIGQDKDNRTIDLSWTLSCPAESTTDRRAIQATYKLIVTALPPVPRTTPWTIRGHLPQFSGCLVVSEPRRLKIDFVSSNAVRPLQSWPGDSAGGFSQGPALYSRPSGIGRFEKGRDLVHSITSSVDGFLMLTVLARSANSVSREVCIYPGDGYNYYPEICTSFQVVWRSSECTSTTSTTTGLTVLSGGEKVSRATLPLLAWMALWNWLV